MSVPINTDLLREMAEIESGSSGRLRIALRAAANEIDVMRQRQAPSRVCGICRTPLDIPGRVWTRNCGGHCLACMADAGDPECVEALAPPVWLPIDTAPKDGSQVLLFASHGGCDGLSAAAPHVATGYFDSIDDAWCGTGSTWLGPFYEPTGWQPLPPPPGAPE